MAFGARSSCKIFEEFACAVQWIWERQTRSADASHYLDDFLFVHICEKIVKWYMDKMSEICNFIGAPLSLEKTEGPVQIISFLGLLINLIKQTVCVPAAKLQKAVTLIDSLVESYTNLKGKQKGKVFVREIQSLTGLLNFISKAVPAGRAFLRCLYDLICGVSKNPHYKVRLNKASIEDLLVWRTFLTSSNLSIAREIPFLNFVSSKEGGLKLFADASGSRSLGFGCYFPHLRQWAGSVWPQTFFKQQKLSITLLELFAIVVAVDIWSESLSGEHVILNFDNQATVFCINKKSAHNKECMWLISPLNPGMFKIPDPCNSIVFRGQKKQRSRCHQQEKIGSVSQSYRRKMQKESRNPSSLPVADQLDSVEELARTKMVEVGVKFVRKKPTSSMLPQKEEVLRFNDVQNKKANYVAFGSHGVNPRNVKADKQSLVETTINLVKDYYSEHTKAMITSHLHFFGDFCEAIKELNIPTVSNILLYISYLVEKIT